MAPDDVEVGHKADIASHDRCDTRPQSIESAQSRPPSMTTVRLSDSSYVSAIHVELPENAQSAEILGRPVQVSYTPPAEDLSIVAHGNEDTTDEVFEASYTTDENRHSSMSIADCQEGVSLTSASSTIRSRSDSSATQSSSGSAQVDWDELERSEEQAPRDEGSDEVHPHKIGKIDLILTHIVVDCFPFG